LKLPVSLAFRYPLVTGGVLLRARSGLITGACASDDESGTQVALGARHLAEGGGWCSSYGGELVMSRPTMSWSEFLTWCDLTASQMRVLAALRQNAAKDLRAWCPVERLGIRVGGRGPAGRAVRDLEKLGLLTVVQKAGPGHARRLQLATEPPTELLQKATANLEAFGKSAAYRVFWLDGTEGTLETGFRGACWAHLWENWTEPWGDQDNSEEKYWKILFPDYFQKVESLPEAPWRVRHVVCVRLFEQKKKDTEWGVKNPHAYLDKAFKAEVFTQYEALCTSEKAWEHFNLMLTIGEAFHDLYNEDLLVEAFHTLADELDDEVLILEAFRSLAEELGTPPDQCGLKTDTSRSQNRDVMVSEPSPLGLRTSTGCISPSLVSVHPVWSPISTTDPDGPPEGGSEVISEQDFPDPGTSASGVPGVRGATPLQPTPCPPPRTATLVEDSGVEHVFEEPKSIDVEGVVSDLMGAADRRRAAGVEEDRIAEISERLLDQ